MWDQQLKIRLAFVTIFYSPHLSWQSDKQLGIGNVNALVLPSI